MKKLFSILVGLALCVGISQAGTNVSLFGKTPEQRIDLYSGDEFQLDLGGAYTVPNYSGKNGLGGLFGVNYYSSKFLGVNFRGAWTYSGDVDQDYRVGSTLRLPLESVGLAPGVKYGVSYNSVGDDSWHWGTYTGLELEYRFTPEFGIVGDATYNWNVDGVDYTQVGLSLRFSF